MCDCFAFLWNEENSPSRPSGTQSSSRSPSKRRSSIRSWGDAPQECVEGDSQRPLGARSSLRLLREGNERFYLGLATNAQTNAAMREQLDHMDSSPHCAIIGCADSLAPLETIFDAMPGDIFSLRNAGNTCTHAEGSMVGSLEFCVGKLDTRLILVLGHTDCGALHLATEAYFKSKFNSTEDAKATALTGLIRDLSGVAAQAAREVGDRSVEQVARHAVKLNVFRTINYLFLACISPACTAVEL